MSPQYSMQQAMYFTMELAGSKQATELLVVGLLGGDDGSVGDEGKVDPWIWVQIGLELIH